MRLLVPTSSMNQHQPMRQVSGASYPPAGQTKNFQFFYKASLVDGPAIAAGLKKECEPALDVIASCFAVQPPNLPFKVYVTDEVDGAMHYGCADTEIYVGLIKNPKTPAASKVYSLLLAAEVTEVFEAAIGLGWNCGYSNGEALSRVIPADIFPGAQTSDLVTVPEWLYKNAPDGTVRPNWIDHTDATDSNSFSVGCSVLFLNWLRYGLDYQWTRVINAGAETLGNVYQNLTGHNNGWMRFKALVDSQFSQGKPHVSSDNPFKPALVGS